MCRGIGERASVCLTPPKTGRRDAVVSYNKLGALHAVYICTNSVYTYVGPRVCITLVERIVLSRKKK